MINSSGKDEIPARVGATSWRNAPWSDILHVFAKQCTHQTLLCYAPVPFMQIKFVGVKDFLSCGIPPLYLDILQYCTVTLQIFYYCQNVFQSAAGSVGAGFKKSSPEVKENIH